jgi:hypothetical protein
MKISLKVYMRTGHGGIRYFPADEWTRDFLAVFERGKRTTFTEKELNKLGRLGFKIHYIS